MEEGNLPGYIRHLLVADSYPHPVGRLDLVQTHISYVVLAGDYVYKWKKPVNFGFVDFSSLEKRKFFCEQELRLNRRLCPDIYLDLVWVGNERGDFSLNGSGEMVEYGIKMVRMPEARMMDHVIVAGGLQARHLTEIVNILVPFYRNTDRGEHLRAYGEVDAVARNIFDNFAQTERFVGCKALSLERFRGIKKYAEAMLRHTDIFTARIAADGIGDCHGDLYSGNICLDNKIHIFDCIEFNDNLRCIDIASDVGFLAMDLDYHGCSELSEFFIASFINASGDDGIRSVLNFYKCYRAYVRGKVGLLAASDATMEKEKARQWFQTAGRYFELAEGYTSRQAEKRLGE